MEKHTRVFFWNYFFAKIRKKKIRQIKNTLEKIPYFLVMKYLSKHTGLRFEELIVATRSFTELTKVCTHKVLSGR